MEKYLLKEEKKKIKNLTTELSKSLNKPYKSLTNIEEEFYNIIKNSKDGNIEDILNNFLNSLTNKIKKILETNITPGMQLGIKNNYFQTIIFGGTYNNSQDEITENTFFSFDSISKLITSTITMQETRNNEFNLNSTINNYNNNYNLNATIESILKFTAIIRTEKRIDNLSAEETIELLKKCKENLTEKSQHKNFYQYNDIGYMILRQTINNFLTKLDNLLLSIDSNNLTYKNYECKDTITGGKLTEEFITPDRKGRDIPFPGHTGLYGNIEGLLNLFEKIICKEDILTTQEKEILFKQPYKDPIVYNKDGTQKLGKNNTLQYMSKVAGIYRKPNGIIIPNYNKLSSCDMSNLTTDKSKAASGTCGSWVFTDNITSNNKFGTYISGILTNPYTKVEPTNYSNNINNIPNTPNQVNKNGVILGYHTKLNEYKEIITEYSLILELITQYIKEIDINYLNKKSLKLSKKII